MMGYILRHINEILHIIIEEKVNGKINRGRPRISYIQNNYFRCGYRELKKLAGDREV